jgi:hypothetical protein
MGPKFHYFPIHSVVLATVETLAAVAVAYLKSEQLILSLLAVQASSSVPTHDE